MSHILEPLVRDNLWQILAADSEIDEVAAEVSLGESGTIDLVARSGDSYTGYEIKSETLTRSGGKRIGVVDQLNRYKESGYLDELYICSIEPEEYVSLLSDDYYITEGPPLGVNNLNQLRDSIAYSINEGAYSLVELREGINVPSVSHSTRTNRNVTSDGRIDKFFSKIETYLRRRDYNSNQSIMGYSEAVDTIEKLVIQVPQEIGIMSLPIEVSRGEAPRYGTKLITGFEEVFSPEVGLGSEIAQEPGPLNRTRTPVLDHANEAWISHHIWISEGGMREATLPNPNGTRAKRVDNLSLEGSKYPQEIVEDHSDGAIKAFEAKTDISRYYWNGRIKDQLKSYLATASITHLYLAVPNSEADVAQSILDESEERWASYVGLVSVDTKGEVRYHIEPRKITIGYDGWSTRQGRIRNVGYGKLTLPNEPDHVAIYGEDDPIREVDPLLDELV